ncbi:hypothetical protein ABE65_018290 [Fictibacillus phosphorivorans]|uniref:DUF2194 domain-containing protein n=1 Tax=Fictibacillus phosphorivorans TaxID=1221500 RepID=A0A160IR10_9BACL|nr:DUF2194 domain-containing protein [Fictibacillus phosphorivorans]ANC78640.1 hypothetical protein ABE65_018290 [Fictibacillus phosphorivorans]
MKDVNKVVWTLMLITILCIIIVQISRIGEVHWLFPQQEVRDKEQALIPTISGAVKGDQLEILVLGNKESLKDNPSMLHLNKSLELAKLSFTYIDSLDRVSASPLTIVVVLDEKKAIAEEDNIRDFVNEGGRLFVGLRFFHPNLNDVMGIERVEGFNPNNLTGVIFKKPFVPIYPDIEDSHGKIPNNSLEVTLQDDSEVYLESQETPILWYHSYGKGKVAYWNGTMLQGKGARGLLLQSLSLLPPRFVSSRLEMSVFFIDDFPAPFPDGDHENITPAFDTSVSSFYKNIWWPDMKELQDQYSLKFTHAFIGTYRADQKMKTEHLIKQNQSKFLFFGRDALRNGDELSLHGYNHQSLVTKKEPIDDEFEYIPWNSQEQMEEGISRVMKMNEHFFPNYTIKTYVPPSNVINKTGIKALSQAAPSIDTISSLYLGDNKQGSFIQEFGYDENNSGYFHLPRVSSGYAPDLYEQFSYADALANAGILSHFIHPDDLLDPYRNKGFKWPDLNVELDRHLKNIYETYPFLKGVTAQEAKKLYLSYSESEMSVDYQENQLIIYGKNLVSPSVFLIRLNDNEKLETGAFDSYSVAKVKGVEGLYTVQTTMGKTVVPIKRGEAE